MHTNEYILSNEFIKLSFTSLGAEMTSIKSQKSNREYLWKADPSFWNRHSPILFPIVGKVWQGKYRINGKEYQLTQHGFARDSEFQCIEKTENSIRFSLVANDTTLLKYPFLFELIISYKLSKNKVIVEWFVKNTDTKDIYFQIGAHPAFNYYDPKEEIKAYMSLDSKLNVISETLNKDGYLSPNKSYAIELNKGLFCIKDDSFRGKTWILEKNQVENVTLYTTDKEPFLAMKFIAPVLGIWSPAFDNSPFVCIEPWYGRCDRENYMGEFRDKDFVNRLTPNNTFETKYEVSILKD